MDYTQGRMEIALNKSVVALRLCFSSSQRCGHLPLELKGYRLTASEPDAVLGVLALSTGDMNAEEFCKWLRISSVELSEGEGGG